MVKQQEVTRLLKDAGFHPTGGTNHEHWTDGVRFTQVPRHREISRQMFERIKKTGGVKMTDSLDGGEPDASRLRIRSV